MVESSKPLDKPKPQARSLTNTLKQSGDLDQNLTPNGESNCKEIIYKPRVDYSNKVLHKVVPVLKSPSQRQNLSGRIQKFNSDISRRWLQKGIKSDRLFDRGDRKQLLQNPLQAAPIEDQSNQDSESQNQDFVIDLRQSNQKMWDFEFSSPEIKQFSKTIYKYIQGQTDQIQCRINASRR